MFGSPLAADYSSVPLGREEDEELLTDPKQLAKELARLEKAMRKAAESLDFETAAGLRDRIHYLRAQGLLRA